MWAWVSITKAPLKPFNQMTDKRLLLRVAVKIMSLIGLLFVAGIFVAGLLPEQQPVKTAVIDVSSVEVGAVAFFKPGRRRILVVNSGGDAGTHPYFVAYAQDTVYGCELQLDAAAAVLRATCADVEYDLQGRLLKGTRDHQNLSSPDYRWLDRNRLVLPVQ